MFQPNISFVVLTAKLKKVCGIALQKSLLVNPEGLDFAVSPIPMFAVGDSELLWVFPGQKNLLPTVVQIISSQYRGSCSYVILYLYTNVISGLASQTHFQKSDPGYGQPGYVIRYRSLRNTWRSINWVPAMLCAAQFRSMQLRMGYSLVPRLSQPWDLGSMGCYIALRS